MIQRQQGRDLAQRLAVEFSRLIRDRLNAEELADILRSSRSVRPSMRATHEPCKVNAAMTDAFAHVMYRGPDPSSKTDARLWTVAWALARDAGFPRMMELIETADGSPAYAFVIREMFIYDPHLSDCARFRVDPVQHYGLRTEEVAALENANAPLRARRDIIHTQTGTDNRTEEPVATVRTLASVRRRYPKMEVWHTGGGCFALRLDCDGGGYLLITECDDARVPADDATKVEVGRYAANGDIVEEASSVSIDKLDEWITAALARVGSPKNVEDYFVKMLGASSWDHSLRELPLNAPCGEDCVKAIDTAAGLIKHIRAVFGDDREDLDVDVVEVAREVIGVYWRA